MFIIINFLQTIPIYYGDDSALEIFNEKAYIHVKNEEDVNDAIKKIIEIDKNDELYKQMLKQKIFNDKYYIDKAYTELDVFLSNIFDQDIKDARRRGT